MSYYLFAGRNYYPQGGAGDCKGTFETVEAAQAAFSAITGWDAPEWANIATITNGRFEPILEYPRQSEPYEGWGPWTGDQ